MMNLINILGFQIGWWLCALGAKNSLDYIGPIYMLVFVALHLVCFSKKYSEFILIIIGMILGLVVDSSFKYFNIIDYLSMNIESIFAPAWIVAMWAGFCATLNHSLSWLKNRLFASFILGAVFGPLSYIAGLNMDIIYFISSPVTASIILAITWGISIPFLFWINDKLHDVLKK